MSGNNTPLEPQRVATVVHYVVAKVDPGQLGYVKLNRLLWYADLEHYRWHGVSITGLRHYSRMLQGPMSNDISWAVRRLVNEGKVAERSAKVADYTRREMISLQQPDISIFTAAQISVLDETIKAIAPLSATQLGQMLQDDPLWKQLDNNEAMMIATASVIARPLTPK